MAKSEQQLRHLVFDKLIDIPIYQLENISREEFKHFLGEYYNGSTTNNLTERKIINFTSRTFYRKYRNLYTLLAIAISLLSAIISKILFSKLTVIGIFLYLPFAFLSPVHVIKFATWHLNIESKSNLVVNKLIEINKSICGFRSNRPHSINKKANEIVREIIENEISRLDYKRGQKGQIAFASFMFALFFSCMYVYIMGDSLNDEIIWIANLLGFGDFDLVKNLNTQEVALALFTFAGLFMRYRIESDLEKKRSTLKKSLAKIEEQSSKRSNYLKNIYNRISIWFF